MAFLNGRIQFIRPDVMRDMDVLVEYVERQNKQDNDLRVADSAARIEKYLSEYRAYDIEQETREKIIDSLTPNDEDRLRDAHMKDYHGDKEHWEDSYERFIEDLTSEDLKKIINLSN